MFHDTTEPNAEERGDRSSTGLRTLLLLGLSFVAGYLVGRGKGSGPDLSEVMEERGIAEESPMEIEIQDTTESEGDETEAEAEPDEETEAEGEGSDEGSEGSEESEEAEGGEEAEEGEESEEDEETEG